MSRIIVTVALVGLLIAGCRGQIPNKQGKRMTPKTSSAAVEVVKIKALD